MRIRLTGRVMVQSDRGAFDTSDLPGRQGRLVLAYLALNHHPVPRDELAELVWGDALPRSWERDLSAVISKLKPLLARVGAPDAITGAFGCYELQLPEGATVDVEEARSALARAEAARRDGALDDALAAAGQAAPGPFLPGDEGAWVQARRDELRDVAVHARDIEAGCHRARGETAAAIRAATAAVELEPFRESGYALLMRLLLDAGNRAEVLRVYTRCRTLLVSELGVPPGPEIEAIHHEALHLDLDVVAPARALPSPVALALAPGELLGRQEQLDRLRAAWAAAAKGGSRFVLVAGEPGIGKTRLAAELAAEVYGSGAPVLFGRCEREPLASYQPFTEALRRWVAEAPAPEARAVAGAAQPLAALLPELAARTGMSGTGADDRLALYDAMGALLAGIARDQGLLLIVDDLHAADPPTLLLLRRLATASRPARVLCVCTYRHAEPDLAPELTGLLSQLRLDRLAEELLLSGLDTSTAAALVAARSGRRPSAAEAHELRERTGGNPLFLVALADDPDSAPVRLRDAIGRHLARLPEPSRDAIAAAAVLGHDVDPVILRAMVAGDVELVLRPAITAGLLAEDRAGHLAFAHPLIRETLYDDLPPARRTALHASAAAALEQLRPDAVQELARHFLHTGENRDKAVGYAEAAAREAMARLAYEEALELIDRALDVVPEDDAELRRRLFTARTPAWAGAWHTVHDGARVRVVDQS